MKSKQHNCMSYLNNLGRLCCLCCLLHTIPAFAQDFDDQADIRENPIEEAPPTTLVTSNYRAYPFLNLSKNHIALNGADWTELRNRFDASDDTVISVVHIGDSHIQAEGSTSRTRELLQRRYGNAGRGLIIPFKLAGTNQPLDYSIVSTSKFTTAKAIKQPWPMEMGFTGIALEPQSNSYEFTIGVEQRSETPVDFDIVRMYLHGKPPTLKSVIAPGGARTMYNQFAVGDTITVFLYEPQERITLYFESNGPCQVYGFELQNQMTGLTYHAIGNNGATYNIYNSIPNFGRDLRSLFPHLIIISLGTNEAFGKVTDEAFYAMVGRLVQDIRTNNPEAKLLLTTPAECQRSKTVRTGKGKRRRRVKTYSVNSNVERLRNVILRYGTDHQIPTYDWYAVAGGSGSSDKWIKNQLMKTDRIHNTWAGYALQGSLLYDALQEQLAH